MSFSYISHYVAALLSDAAYTPIGQVASTAAGGTRELSKYGWFDVSEKLAVKLGPYSDYDSSSNQWANEFRVFVNDKTKQVVFAFKGSQQKANFISDLNPADQGYSQYMLIRDQANKYFNYAVKAYEGYTIISDGHSLGGGMAQQFAVEHQIAGYGQNSLPIPPKFIANYSSLNPGHNFEKDLAFVRGVKGFSEINVAGDIATFTYSTVLNGKYIDLHPDTVDSIYADIQQGAFQMARVSGPQILFGGAVAFAAGVKAHFLSTLEPLIEFNPVYNGSARGMKNIPLPTPGGGNLLDGYKGIAVGDGISFNDKNGASYTVKFSGKDVNLAYSSNSGGSSSQINFGAAGATDWTTQVLSQTYTHKYLPGEKLDTSDGFHTHHYTADGKLIWESPTGTVTIDPNGTITVSGSELAAYERNVTTIKRPDGSFEIIYPNGQGKFSYDGHGSIVFIVTGVNGETIRREITPDGECRITAVYGDGSNYQEIYHRDGSGASTSYFADGRINWQSHWDAAGNKQGISWDEKLGKYTEVYGTVRVIVPVGLIEDNRQPTVFADGSIVTTYYHQVDASYNHVSLPWSGWEIFNAPFSRIAREVHKSAAGVTTTKEFQITGLISQKIVDDGQGNVETLTYHSNGLTSNATQVFADGSKFISKFDKLGALRYYEWHKADGSHGVEVINEDGSGSGSVTNADGSHSDFTTDANGRTNTLHFDFNNVSLTDVEMSESGPVPANVKNVVLQGSGDLTVQANSLGNRIVANAGNSVVLGGSGDDILVSGTGNATFTGGGGADTYVITAVRGKITILNGDSEDLLVFAEGTVASRIRVTEAQVDGVRVLTVQPENGPEIVVKGGSLSNVSFADGSTTTLNALLAASSSALYASTDVVLPEDKSTLILIGSGSISAEGNSHSHTIIGNDGVNRLVAGTGQSTLIGGRGTTTFVVNKATDKVVASEWAVSNKIQTSSDYTATNFVTDLAAIGKANLRLTGNALANVITGGSGADTLHGMDGDDTLVGGAGDDMLDGGAGADIYLFGSGNGNDTIAGDAVSDAGLDTVRMAPGLLPESVMLSRDENSLYLWIKGSGEKLTLLNWFEQTWKVGGVRSIQFENGVVWDTQIMQVQCNSGSDQGDLIYSGTGAIVRAGEGNDTIYGSDGADSLAGDDGADRISASNGDDHLVGGNGDDSLEGGAGQDTLEGGAGNDLLLSTGDGDHYVFRRGFGQDHIHAGWIVNGVGKDVIEFDASIIANDLVGKWIGNELTLSIRGTADSLLITPQAIEYVVFADGTTWDTAALYSWVNKPTSEADLMYGHSGNDTLTGAGGNDTLDGGEGDDTYLYGVNGGNDTIRDSAGNDVLKFDSSMDGAKNGWFTRSANNLIFVSFAGGRITIERYFSDGGSIERFEFSDGSVWNVSDKVAHLAGAYLFGTNGSDQVDGSAGRDTLNGMDGNDTVLGNDGDDSLYGGAGEDLMEGGKGGDQLFGQAGSDIYRFNRGDGVDHIFESDSSTDVDILRLGEGILPTDVSLSRSNTMLILTIGADAVRIGGWFDGANTVECIEFHNGTVWRAADVDALMPRTTEGPDDLYGTTASEEFNALGGNDTVFGDEGDDTVYGGEGDDQIDGDVGDDLIYGDEGADTLYGYTGQDTIHGGAGDDRIDGYQGDDTIYGEEGDDYLDGDDENDLLFGGDGADYLYGYLGDDTLHGDAGDDEIDGSEGSNVSYGGAGSDTIYGYDGQDTMYGGADNDFYIVDDVADTVVEAANEGIDQVTAAISFDLGDEVEVLILDGATPINGSGNDKANMLIGNSASNDLVGGLGNDILQGDAGDDFLIDSGGSTVAIGGGGNDSITVADGSSFLAGGVGNDTLTLAGQGNVIAFNRGDGADTVLAAGAGLTVSLGSEIAYGDIALQKSNHDLLLKLGNADQILLKDWYNGSAAAQNSQLQMVIQGSAAHVPNGLDPMSSQGVQVFDLDSLVAKFDAARSADPALVSWSVSPSLASARIQGSDNAAVGAEFALQYALTGNLSAMTFNPALAILSNGEFGSVLQTLLVGTPLVDDTPHLI